MSKQVKPVWSIFDDETDETDDCKDGEQREIAEALPGVVISRPYQIDKSDESKAAYSVKAEGGGNFSLYHGQGVIGSYTALELLKKLSSLDLVMPDKAAKEIGFPDAKDLYWESARESLPGKFAATDYLEGAFDSWRRDWSIELDDDGWNLYVVYAPAEHYSYEYWEAKPRQVGCFRTKKEALEEIGKEGSDQEL